MTSTNRLRPVDAYDPNGNQTREGARTFSYDLANRLKGTDQGTTEVAYTYDGDGVRTQATVTQLLVTATTQYLWDRQGPLPELAIERDGAGKLLRRYVHGHGVVSETVPDLLPPITPEEETFPYHADGTGSTLALTDSDGNVQWRYTFDPYGGARKEEKADLLAPENRMRFTGQMLDSETGLYHLRARQYAPGTGRFLQTDPKDRATGEPYVGAYVYADDRPTVLVDPSGRRGQLVGCWFQAIPFPAVGTSCSQFDPTDAIQDMIEDAKKQDTEVGPGQGLIEQLCEAVGWAVCAEFLVAVGLEIFKDLLGQRPNEERWLFRNGSATAVSFTPRPPLPDRTNDVDEYPDNGLTTWASRDKACEEQRRRGVKEKVQVLYRPALPWIPGLNLRVASDDPAHIYLQGDSWALHLEWAWTRPGVEAGTQKPHRLTEAIRLFLLPTPVGCI